MNVIVCLDDRDGILFNRRRQSADAAICDRICAMIGEKKLYMNNYSAKQFAQLPEGTVVDEAFLDRAEQGAYCFVENTDITPYAEQVEQIVIYRWNRKYPYDVTFPMYLFAPRMLLESSCDFPGNSHETITQEIYSL